MIMTIVKSIDDDDEEEEEEDYFRCLILPNLNPRHVTRKPVIITMTFHIVIINIIIRYNDHQVTRIMIIIIDIQSSINHYYRNHHNHKR